MNIKIVLINLITVLLLANANTSFAEQRLNGREAAEVCKTEITHTYASEHSIRFSRRPASSLKAGFYTFWINATEEIAGERGNMKYQCEITRTGELVELTREPGRWNI